MTFMKTPSLDKVITRYADTDTMTVSLPNTSQDDTITNVSLGKLLREESQKLLDTDMEMDSMSGPITHSDTNMDLNSLIKDAYDTETTTIPVTSKLSETITKVDLGALIQDAYDTETSAISLPTTRQADTVTKVDLGALIQDAYDTETTTIPLASKYTDTVTKVDLGSLIRGAYDTETPTLAAISKYRASLDPRDSVTPTLARALARAEEEAREDELQKSIFLAQDSLFPKDSPFARHSLSARLSFPLSTSKDTKISSLPSSASKDIEGKDSEWPLSDVESPQSKAPASPRPIGKNVIRKIFGMSPAKDQHTVDILALTKRV
jgi:hypothetical protein